MPLSNAKCPFLAPLGRKKTMYKFFKMPFCQYFFATRRRCSGGFIAVTLLGITRNFHAH